MRIAWRKLEFNCNLDNARSLRIACSPNYVSNIPHTKTDLWYLRGKRIFLTGFRVFHSTVWNFRTLPFDLLKHAILSDLQTNCCTTASLLRLPVLRLPMPQLRPPRLCHRPRRKQLQKSECRSSSRFPIWIFISTCVCMCSHPWKNIIFLGWFQNQVQCVWLRLDFHANKNIQWSNYNRTRIEESLKTRQEYYLIMLFSLWTDWYWNGEFEQCGKSNLSFFEWTTTGIHYRWYTVVMFSEQQQQQYRCTDITESSSFFFRELYNEEWDVYVLYGVEGN